MATPRGPERVSCERVNVRRPKPGTASARLGKPHTGKVKLLQRWTLEAYPGKKMAVPKVCRHVGEFNNERTSAPDLGLRRGAEVRTKHRNGRGLSQQSQPRMQIRFHPLSSAGRIVLAPLDARYTHHPKLSWDDAP